MAQRHDLEAAAAAGVLSPDQVEPLIAFLSGRVAPIPAAVAIPAAPTGEEDLRFIRNFHDVFLSIGIVIFAIGMVLGGFALMGDAALGGGESPSTVPAAFVFILSAAGQWGLAEVFAKRRRLFLPSIVLCLAFVGFLTAAVTLVMGQFVIAPMAEQWGSEIDADSLPRTVALTMAIMFATASLAAAGFIARFRLPFAMGVLGACLALLVLAVIGLAAPAAFLPALPWWSLLGGLALFAAAVWYDARDPARKTLLSDNGFWLHFAAAPLILNGALTLVAGTGFWAPMVGLETGEFGSEPNVGAAAVTLLVVIGLGLVSLLINRRALIVSALLTTGTAIGVLIDALGLDFSAFAAITLLLLGGAVLLLGAGWHTARRALLGWVKPGGFWARIFPPEATAE
jgi:hypothetical protein